MPQDIRPASSYRGARRNEYRSLPFPAGVKRSPWALFNTREPFGVGSHPNPGMVLDGRAYKSIRTRYPHTGTKQRARHAGRPDGLMHRETPGLRSNTNKRLRALISNDSVPVTAKKARKPRAKKADAAA